MCFSVLCPPRQSFENIFVFHVCFYWRVIEKKSQDTEIAVLFFFNLKNFDANVGKITHISLLSYKENSIILETT